MKNKKFYSVVTEFSDEGFEKFKYKTISWANHKNAINLAIKNLHLLINVRNDLKDYSDKEKQEILGGSISDYAWTKEVSEKFWDWDFHKKVKKFIKNKIGDFAWGMLMLDIDPVDIDEMEKLENEKENK